MTRSSTAASGFEFPADWANKGVPPEQILEALRPLLQLPVEIVLPTHGAPTDRAALERALSNHDPQEAHERLHRGAP